MGKKLSYPVIRAIGIASIIGVSGLTAFTVNMAVNDANDRANGAYMSALGGVQYSANDSINEPTDFSIEEPTEESTTEEPATEEPVTEEPTVEEPTEEPTIEEPVVEQPTELPTEAPTEELIIEEPVIEEPVADDDTTEEPTVDDPDPDSVVKTPDDLGYDLTNVSIKDDGRVVYTVQPGDWLSRIGERYGFTVQELAAANTHIKNVDLIHSGDHIELPGDKSFVEYVRYYKGLSK